MADNFYDDVYYRAKGNSTKFSNDVLTAKDREIDFFNRIFRPQEGTALLGLGCGSGDYLGSLKDRNIDVWGIDISEIATMSARKKVRKPEQIICANAEKLPFEDKKFNYVTAWGVVEHFECLKSILGEIHRVLHPKGTAVIMVPNLFYYKFIWDALRKGAGPVRHQKVERLYAFQEWKTKIEACGFEIYRIERHNKFNKAKLSWIRKMIPFYLSNHFVFFCKKKE